jgi:hypothetical protein
MSDRTGIDPGFAAVAGGAALVTLSTFLPWQESPTWAPIQHNTLIQHDGWILIALSFGAALVSYRDESAKHASSILRALLVALSALYLVNEANADHTLYPINSDGTADMSAVGVPGSFGIAIYVAWLGIAAMAFGALLLHNEARKRRAANLPDLIAQTDLPSASTRTYREDARTWLDRVKRGGK